MGHFALTDVRSQRFYAFERFARGALGLAGAERNPLRIWIEDWYITYEIMDEEILDAIRLKATEDNIALELTLRNLKPIVLNGENGLSQKGAEPGNASYYYSMTRLKCDGEIHIGDKTHAVTGSAWLDREWSTSALDQNQVGWDWFSLQLNNNVELMYYQIRRKDGNPDPFSKGTLVDQNGKYEMISLKDINLNVLDSWESPHGGQYPSGWKLELPNENIILHIKPAMKNQELNVSFRYWEGAVVVDGQYKGDSVEGMGYVELTGYADREFQ
jgi:predicted secreted hydrolase